MSSESLKHNDVILAFLNALDVEDKTIVDMKDLRDGVVFAKILNSV